MDGTREQARHILCVSHCAVIRLGGDVTDQCTRRRVYAPLVRSPRMESTRAVEKCEALAPHPRASYAVVAAAAVTAGLAVSGIIGVTGLPLDERGCNMQVEMVGLGRMDGAMADSWLLDLITHALAADPQLKNIAPYVADSGEGRWTVQEAMRLDVPTPVIALSLLERFRSRDDYAFADRLLAAMRGEFGGHAVLPAPPPPATP